MSRSTARAVGFTSLSASTTRKSVRLPGCHGRFLELRRHHFAEAFEAAHFDLGVGVKFFLEQPFLMFVIARIDDLAAMRESIERRHRQVELPALDQFWHLAIEKGDQQ